MNNNRPWWWPCVIDDAHLASLRDDYPEMAHLDDDELLDYFDDGKEKGQFSTTWDTVHDAYSDYEKLAQAFLLLVDQAGKVPSDFDEI